MGLAVTWGAGVTTEEDWALTAEAAARRVTSCTSILAVVVGVERGSELIIAAKNG